MKHKLMRRGRLTGTLLVAALLLTACPTPEDEGPVGEPAPDDDDAVEAPDEPTPGGSVTIGLEAETAGWAPWEHTWSPPGWTVARSFYDPLLERDEDGVPQPFLAESIEPNEEFTQYTLTLREGLTFHDGAALDADAVVTNIERHREPGAVTGAAVAPIEDVRAEDELTVVIELDQPHVAFPDYLAPPSQLGMMVSPDAFEDAGSEPVGAGPFVFEEWTRDQSLSVSRNDDYWREDLPYLDDITFRPIPDEDARLQSLFAGDTDAAQTLRQAPVSQALEREDEFNIYFHVGNNTGATIMNTAVPPFDDVRVRQAWAHAIDQQELRAVLGDPEGELSALGSGKFNPDSPWFVEEMQDLWPRRDLDRAQELIDEYVDDPERSDGEEPGTPVSFTFDTPPDPSLLETSAVYQANVAEIGMEMEINTVEQAAHIQGAVQGDFEAKIWRVGTEADPDALFPGYAPESPVNFTNFEHEEVIGAFLEARRTPDFEDRRELYHRINQIFAEEVPFTQTAYTVSIIATADNIFGFDTWELPDGARGVGHPEAVGRWHGVWVHQE